MKSPQARRQRPGFHQRCHQSQLQSNSVPPTHRKRPPHAWALPAVLTIHLVAGINYWMLSRDPSLMLLGPSQHHGLFPFLVLWGRPCALFRSRGRPCLCRRLPLPSARGTSLDSSGPSADASVLGAWCLWRLPGRVPVFGQMNCDGCLGKLACSEQVYRLP